MTDHISHILYHLKCHGDPKPSQSHHFVINERSVNDPMYMLC